MSKDREINIIGDINEEAFKAFHESLTELEKSSKKDVFLNLFSSGGEAHAGLAFAARMRLSPCTLVVTIYGYCASAATAVLASGDVRRMTAESWVMVHEDSCKLSNNVSGLEIEIRQLRRLEDQWNQILYKASGTPPEVWTKLNKETTYLSPEECQAYGLITEII